MPRTLLVTDLPAQVSKTDIERAFKSRGHVNVDVGHIYKPANRNFCAVVTFPSTKAANKALQDIKNFRIGVQAVADTVLSSFKLDQDFLGLTILYEPSTLGLANLEYVLHSLVCEDMELTNYCI